MISINDWLECGGGGKGVRGLSLQGCWVPRGQERGRAGPWQTPWVLPERGLAAGTGGT